MTEIQIAWLELMTVGGLGVILVLLGVTFNIIVKRQNQLCTKQTDGIVKQYGFPGNGRVYPIVEYFVNGTCYKTKKKFRGIKTTQISGVPVPVKSEVYEDEKGWLHVKTGSIANLRQLAEQLWPINSKMTVYYNPNNPKKCYVDRPISKSFTSMMFIIMGIVTILLSVYCIYPKIAVVALIFSFVQCALIVPLEMIDDLVFQNKGFQPTGMFTALGFVIIYVIIFSFCALAPKFGMNGKKWKSLIGRLNVKQSETDYSKEVSAALASQAVGRFLKESDNDTAKNIGSAMQVAGAVSTVSTSIDMLSEAGSNAENMAHAYRIPIPDIKKQLIAFAVIPILIVVGTYIPQYIKGKQAMDQRIAASAKQVEIVKKALEPVCVRVHADNPNESRSRSSYTVMGYLRDSGATDCYVHVQVNNSGTIINISYVEGVDINKSLEENLMQTEKDFATLQKSFENLNVSVSNPEILSYQAIPQQFTEEFLNGTFYKSFRFYDQDAPISLSCSFDTETEDQFDEYTRPKIHFFLGSK